MGGSIMRRWSRAVTGSGAKKAPDPSFAENWCGGAVFEHQLAVDHHGADGLVVAVHHSRQTAELLEP